MKLQESRNEFLKWCDERNVAVPVSALATWFVHGLDNNCLTSPAGRKPPTMFDFSAEMIGKFAAIQICGHPQLNALTSAAMTNAAARAELPAMAGGMAIRCRRP